MAALTLRRVTSYMSGKTFVDTNILIYAHDRSAGARRITAGAALEGLWDTRLGVVSPQVLQEFYVNVTRKIAKPLTRAQARSVVDVYSSWCVDATTEDVQAAFRMEDTAKISFWDALICASALRSGASTVLSEDLNAGQKIAGLRIVNPFQSAK